MRHAQFAPGNILDRFRIFSKAPRCHSQRIVFLPEPGDLDRERPNLVPSLCQIEELRQAYQRDQQHDRDTDGHQQALRQTGTASCL